MSEDSLDGNGNNIKIQYRPSKWSKCHSTYDPEPMEFRGENVGLTHTYESLPSYIQLFSLFWPLTLSREIAFETNRYAGSLDNEGRTWGRDGWYPVT